MRSPTLMLVSLLAVAAAAQAQAQSVPPASHASDSWDAPASASTVGYRDAAAPATADGTGAHFKFKERNSHPLLPDNAAQEHSGKARVGGMGGMDRSGRPAVSCPQTPMDPACH